MRQCISGRHVTVTAITSSVISIEKDWDLVCLATEHSSGLSGCNQSVYFRPPFFTRCSLDDLGAIRSTQNIFLCARGHAPDFRFVCWTVRFELLRCDQIDWPYGCSFLFLLLLVFVSSPVFRFFFFLLLVLCSLVCFTLLPFFFSLLFFCSLLLLAPFFFSLLFFLFPLLLSYFFSGRFVFLAPCYFSRSFFILTFFICTSCFFVPPCYFFYFFSVFSLLFFSRFFF